MSRTERELLDVSLTVGDVECDVSSSTLENTDRREVTIQLTEDGFEEYIRELRLEEYSDDARDSLKTERDEDE